MGKSIDLSNIGLIIENNKIDILRGEHDGYAIMFEYLLEHDIFKNGNNKENYELISYIKFKLNKPLEAFYYGFESYKISINSIGILIAAVSIFKLRREIAGRFVAKYEKEIRYIMESNKFSKDVFQYSQDFTLLEKCLKTLGNKKNAIKGNEFKYIEDLGYYYLNDGDFELKSYQESVMLSMHLLRYKDEYLILDCGATNDGKSVEKADIDDFLKDIPKEQIKGAIISHAHLDHYGSIDLLYDYVDKVYMNKTTLDIINISSMEPIIDMKKINLYKDYKSFDISGFHINPIPNGHMMGSSAFMISFDSKNLFYTGDFCLSNQNTVSGLKKKDIEILMKEEGKIGYLLTESTYGHKEEWLTYSQRKEILKRMIEKSYSLNVRTFIPSFAIGRAQECHSIINESDSMYVLVDGLASRITSYYNRHSISSNLITRKTIIPMDQSIEEKFNEASIIIASSGMLQEGSTSMEYYNQILKSDDITTVIKCGYIDEETTKNKLKKMDGIKINLIEINLSAHGQYEEVIELIEFIRPKKLIMVHGEGIEGLNYINNSKFSK